MSRENTDNYRSIFLQNTPLIDTRAPVEYAKGAFPTARNLPLMSDEERHQVGTRYKQSGQDAAIALGRKLVSLELQQQRTEKWLTFAKENPQGYLYCFRGGLRSRITQSWMDEAGIQYPYITGGYKAMRRYLIESLEQNINNTPLVLISGRTGTGKTLVLKRLNHHIDLEGLAAHRGSSFGLLENPQPTTINFENNLSIDILKACNPRPPHLFLEAEGRLIGSVCLPLTLWEKMSVSPAVVLESPMDKRVEIAIQDYVVDLTRRLQARCAREDAILQLGERHRHSLFRIRKRLGGSRYEQAIKLLNDALDLHLNKNEYAAYNPFIELLLKDYYDPMYDYQQEKRSSRILFRGNSHEILEWANSSPRELMSLQTVPTPI